MRLPLLSSKELIKILAKIGYAPVRQKGSHIRLVCADRPPITIPDYRAIDRSLIKRILRQANLNDDDFLDIMRR